MLLRLVNSTDILIVMIWLHCVHTVTACVSSVVAVSEILAADRQLAQEIEFDLKRFEEEQKKIAKPQTPLTATPHAQMVSQIKPKLFCMESRFCAFSLLMLLAMRLLLSV